MSVTSRQSRRPQQRSKDTREALLAEATRMFTTLGYEGVSMRALETAAQVQHGAVSYHFKNKETLWKAAIDQLITDFQSFFEPMQATMADLDNEARLRMAIAALIRFSATRPEFDRLMAQEGHTETWRSRYLIDNFLHPGLGWLNDMLGLNNNPHSYHIVIGSVTHVFRVAYACSELFGVDPTSDTFIKEHSARVADMLIAMNAKGTNQT